MLTFILSCYWSRLSRGVVKGRLQFSQASSAASGSPRITRPCLLLLCPVSLSAGFTPSPSSFIVSSVPPALLPDSPLARWTLYLLTPVFLFLVTLLRPTKTRLGCLHTNINNVIVYHLKAVSGSVCVWLGMAFSLFSQRSPRPGRPKSVSGPSPTLVPWPCWACRHDPAELVSPLLTLTVCFIRICPHFKWIITFWLSLRNTELK